MKFLFLFVLLGMFTNPAEHVESTDVTDKASDEPMITVTITGTDDCDQVLNLPLSSLDEVGDLIDDELVVQCTVSFGVGAANDCESTADSCDQAEAEFSDCACDEGHDCFCDHDYDDCTH